MLQTLYNIVSNYNKGVKLGFGLQNTPVKMINTKARRGNKIKHREIKHKSAINLRDHRLRLRFT